MARRRRARRCAASTRAARRRAPLEGCGIDWCRSTVRLSDACGLGVGEAHENDRAVISATDACRLEARVSKTRQQAFGHAFRICQSHGCASTRVQHDGYVVLGHLLRLSYEQGI